MLLLRSCVVSTVRDKVSIHRIGPSQSTAWSELLFATGTSTVLILSIVLRGRRHMVRLLTGQWGTNFPQAHASTRVIRLSLPLRRERSDTAKCKTASRQIRNTQYSVRHRGSPSSSRPSPKPRRGRCLLECPRTEGLSFGRTNILCTVRLPAPF